MSETYDPYFETQRLIQLSDQCLGGTEISGELIFRSSTNENRLEVVSWFFGDHDYSYLKESSFQPLLMRLLDDLIIYRTRCGMTDSREGHIILSQSKPSITWLADGQGEILAAEYKLAEDWK